MIQIDTLIKRYSSFQLGPVDLELSPGTCYGLLGPNGAGKTTLLGCLSGQLIPDSGSVVCGGEPVEIDNWKLREKLAFMPERPVLYGDLPVARTIQFASRVYTGWQSARAKDLMARFELPADRKVKHLSKGMQVKLQILLALCHNARYLVLDEPSSGLDPSVRWELQSLLLDLLEETGCCLIVSSHLFEDLVRVAAEVIILRAGQIVCQVPMMHMTELRLCRFPVDRIPASVETRRERTARWRTNGFEYALLTADQVGDLDSDTGEMGENAPSLEEIYFATQGRRY